MSKIVTDIQLALERIEDSSYEAAIDLLRDLDNNWEAELKAAQEDPRLTQATAEAFINGKNLLLQLLSHETQTPAIEKEIDTVYQTLILLAAEQNVRQDVVEAYASLLAEKKRYPSYELALADLYGLISQHLQDDEKELFRLADSAAYAEKAANLYRAHNPASAETASALFFLAQTLTKLGNWDDAIHAHQESLKIYRRLNRYDPSYDTLVARSALCLAHLQRSTGQFDAAKNSYREAIRLWKQHNDQIVDQVYQAKASVCLVRLLDPHEDAEAEELLWDVLHIFWRGGRIAEEAADRLCVILEQQGRMKEVAAVRKRGSHH